MISAITKVKRLKWTKNLLTKVFSFGLPLSGLMKANSVSFQMLVAFTCGEKLTKHGVQIVFGERYNTVVLE